MQKQDKHNGIQIRVRPETHRQLVELGNLEDTFDSVIQRLLREKKK
jgi:predicted CopG family antitoxin